LGANALLPLNPRDDAGMYFVVARTWTIPGRDSSKSVFRIRILLRGKMKKYLLAFAITVCILPACSTPATPATELTQPLASTEASRPISLASDGEVSNPALEIEDIRVEVKDDQVDAIFYLKDVPEEMTFDKEGLNISDLEYKWEICVDVDNDVNTGYALESSSVPVGTDYCLAAMHAKTSDTPQTVPIEQDVEVILFQAQETGIMNLSTGTIEVDSGNNTIHITGTIYEITSSSKFYYDIYGDGVEASGAVDDPVFIEG
jgi:hypothetical protein